MQPLQFTGRRGGGLADDAAALLFLEGHAVAAGHEPLKLRLADTSLSSPAFAGERASAHRWVVWAIPTWIFTIAFFHRPAPGVITKELMQDFAAGGTMVGLLSAAYFYTYAGLMIPAGVLVDAFGVRRVVSIGGAVMGAGALAMAMAPTEAMLFAGRLAVGAGAAVTFVGALKIAATWFAPSEFGTLAALTATAGALGALFATAPLAWLVALAGWRGAFAVVGIATFAGVVLCWAVVRDRPDGARPSDAPAEAARARLAVAYRGLLAVAGNRHTWPPFFAFFFLYAATGNLMLWGIPYLRDSYALGRSDAAIYAAATSIAVLGAGPLAGWLSDRWGQRRRAFIALALGLGITWVVFVATLGTLPLAGVAAVLFMLGVFSACFVLVWPLGRDVNPAPLAGVAVAVVNFGGFLGAAVTQGPLGALLDAFWDGGVAQGARVYPLAAYRAAFVVCTVFAVASFVSGLFLRETPPAAAER